MGSANSPHYSYVALTILLLSAYYFRRRFLALEKSLSVGYAAVPASTFPRSPPILPVYSSVLYGEKKRLQ